MNFSNKTAIVKFWAPWCQPCHVVAPTVKDVAASNGLDLIEVNVDEDHQTAGAFGVRSIPMVVGVKDGQVVDQVIGAQSKARYEELASKLR